jgi:acylphosphatase
VSDNAIRRVLIQGVVQGVGYRAWVEREANARDLEGWVRNRRDGSVEALFAGPAAVVTEMIAACRQGPRMAKVATVNDHPDHRDALKMRSSGERFSVLSTI